MLKFLGSIVRVVLLVGLIGFVSAKGPELHAAFIRAYVGSNVVMLLNPSKRSGGSGFFVRKQDGSNVIVTNNHVCELEENGMLNVVLPSGSEMLRKVRMNYKLHDLCIVEGVPGHRGLRVADKVHVGEGIGIIGHPKLHPLTLSKGENIGTTNIKVLVAINTTKEKCDGTFVERGKTKKIPQISPRDVVATKDISDIIRFFFVQNYCIKSYTTSQLHAYSRGGSSGSPVVDFYGNVVGVLFAGNTSDPHESFAVPLDNVRDFLKEY